MEKLFMLLIGCKPPGRHTEQHDIFFGIGHAVKDLVPAINRFWPSVKNKFHIDGWREVTHVDGFDVHVEKKEAVGVAASAHKLFFINLGGYKAGEFDEFHYKMIVAARDRAEAIKKSKNTAFFKHTGFKTAPAHVDDKYGIDVDDLYDVEEILTGDDQNHYRILLSAAPGKREGDSLHLGYFPIRSLK